MSTSTPQIAGRLDGGRLPPIGQLLSETMNDMMANIGPYALSGLGLFVVAMPIGMIVAMVGLGGMYFVMFAGIMASAGVGQATGDDDAGAAIAAFGSMGSMAAGFFVFFGVMMFLNSLMAPLSASLSRAIAEHQRGGTPLDFKSAFSTVGQNAGSAAGVAFLKSMAAMIGVMFCYVGALVPAMLFAFALEMVAIHGKGAMQALRTTARAAMADPGAHVLFALVYFGISMVAAYVPLLGMMFMLALHVRAYRHLFGDGEEPHALVPAG